MDPLSLAGRTAIVTGAAAGIGRAITEDLCARGASIIANDYGGDWSGNAGSSARIDAFAADLAGRGANVAASCLDVSHAETPRSLVELALKEFGSCDILVNCAGVTLSAEFESADLAALERIVQINLWGTWRMMRAVWPVMKGQGRGRIVNVSSNAVMGGYGRVSAYSASKGGILGLTADAASEGLPHGILVNSLVPIAYTRMAGDDIVANESAYIRWLRNNFPPAQVAPVATWLASDDNKDVSGEAFCVGAGRVSRLVFATNPGLTMDRLTAEAVGANIAAIRDTSSITPVLSGPADGARYMEVYPFNPDEDAPALTAGQIDEADRDRF